METFQNLTDSELISLLNQDSEAGFTEVYARYFDALLRHALKMTFGDPAAADLVHDVFANMWVKRHGLVASSPAALKYYLFTSVKNAVLNDRRNTQTFERNMADFVTFITTHAEPADQDLIDEQLRAAIEEEIQSLPDRMREVFLMRREEDMSLDEIAMQLNVSKHTVKSQLNTAAQRLWKKLSVYFLMLIIITLG